MRKFFTYIFAMLMLFVSIVNVQGQTVVWPTADAATIAASQFSDSSQIFKPTTATPNPPAGFKGWVSKAISSDDPAKLINTQWDWTRDGKGTKGAFFGTRGAIGSASAANGAAIFNSDFLDNKGTGDFGNGLSPTPHGADLISPIIDATGKNDLTIVFNQYFRNFDTPLTAVTWSEDGGTTWKDTIKVIDNLIIATNTEINNLAILKLKKSKGTANFRVKFIFSGNYYFWIVDDVKLVSTDKNLRVNKNWYATPQNYTMPRHQVDTVVFMADVENQGNLTSPNVKLTVDIRDSNNVSVYNAVRNYGSLKADSVAENEVFGKWLPSTTGKGTYAYTGSYIISSDNVDNYPSNDTIRFPFLLTDSLYQNDQGISLLATRPGDGAWPSATSPHNWKVGNYYYFPKGSAVTATRIRAFVDSSTLVGVPLLASLYSWDDKNGDGLVQVAERTQIAAGEVVVPKVGNPVGIDFPLELIGAVGPVKLKDKTAYIAMVELITTKTTVNMRAYFSEGTPYAPMAFATAKLGRPRYTNVISYDGTDTRDWNTGTFFGDDLEQYVSLVRMWSWPIRTDTKELLSDNNKINLFPNPAQSTLNVDFDLEKTEQAVLVRIIDMSGKILKERDYSDVKKQTISMDVNDIPNGIYNVQIQTLGNYRTMRFVKAD